MSTKWFVYILLCTDHSLYTGISPDPKKRFEEHKKGKGGAYTRSYKPIKLLYTEGHATKSEALKREIELKNMPRKIKIDIITHAPA